jgi:photosynthetic reaction center cytochrome c subunit
MNRRIQLIAAVTFVVGLCACEHPPVDTQQHGYRGTGMVQVANPQKAEALLASNTVPAATPMVPADGPRAAEVYQNVKVLGDLSAGEFGRLMVAITSWVAPNEGCAYCHEGPDMAADNNYKKIVARRMLEMTRHINSTWGSHVKATGVTCYTCHRGKHVPENVWFANPGPVHAAQAGDRRGQNAVNERSVAYSALPYDPFTPFLVGDTSVRVISTTALPAGNSQDIAQTEHTYGLMMHISQALGVNCTYCHNTRSFASWDASTPQRGTAWYGIRLVRDLNQHFLAPLQGTLPATRLGPLGDVAKANCATCHQGLNKPLNGVSMYKDYPELGAPRPPPAPPEAPAAAEGTMTTTAAAAAPAATS